MEKIKNDFAATYSPLITEFIENVRHLNCEGIPEPFLPVCGELYPEANTRIMFVGMETRGWGHAPDFIKRATNGCAQLFAEALEEFNELEFCFWGNNFGNSFWDFILKFLAAFHGLDDWKSLRRQEHKEILQSFAWANANAIERYQVTAQKNGVLEEDYKIFKRLSLPFDNGGYLISVFKPRLMMITNWSAHESWLQSQTVDLLVRQEISEYFWYYFLPSTQTHVLWTPHPVWLAKNEDFDQYIEYLVSFAKERIHLT